MTLRPQIKRYMPEIIAGLKLLAALYLFLLAVKLIAVSFTLASEGHIRSLISRAGSPLMGLLIGVLSTSLVQSSSSTTSLTVALTVSGALPFHLAIYIVMGANIGTCITNVLVSLTHITRRNEFGPAFAAAVVQNFFNLISVILIFPLEYFFGYLTRISAALSGLVSHLGGIALFKPLDWVIHPGIRLVQSVLGADPLLIGLAAAIILFLALRQMVVSIKQLMLDRIRQAFGIYFFKNYGRAMLSGTVITAIVQSSSVTTSLVVPFAAARVLTLEQIFPFTLGANIGTTVTTMLAALCLGQPVGLQIALAHLIFNITGIILITPVRGIPINLARGLAQIAGRNRLIPLLFVLGQFFILPLAILFFGR
ncbi:MAG: Na/Pi symporter [Acidobacteriota bacterium]|jgi:sodium-dependent phosphate cotransporter|nr:Na/Pi symporter [Acidobacteriota bacterium]